MQIDLLNQKVDSLNRMPRKTAAVESAEESTKANTGSSKNSRKSSTDLGPEAFRVVIVSTPTEMGAQRFINRSKLNTDDMLIAYIEELDTYRVIYKSSSDLNEAKKFRTQARKQYSDAWIGKF